MSPARARTRTARSGVERTNHEATAPRVMLKRIARPIRELITCMLFSLAVFCERSFTILWWNGRGLKGGNYLLRHPRTRKQAKLQTKRRVLLLVQRDFVMTLERLRMNTNKPRKELKRGNLIGSAKGARHVGLVDTQCIASRRSLWRHPLFSILIGQWNNGHFMLRTFLEGITLNCCQLKTIANIKGNTFWRSGKSLY